MSELAHHMETVAKLLLGEPNRSLSSKEELRYGSNGSLAIDLQKGAFYDHENEEGGGVLDLIRRQKGIDNGEAAAWLREQGILEKKEPVREERRHTEATYDYADEAGEPLFQVVRFGFKDARGNTILTEEDGKPKKTFRQRRMAAGEWVWDVKGVRPVPYRLPELIEAIANDHLVFIAEGEKCVDRLVAAGVPATCNVGGAKKWKDELSAHFQGAKVVVLRDNDDAGRDHGQLVAEKLQGIAESVLLLDLEGLPPKGDVFDWLEAGHDAEELYRLVETKAVRPSEASKAKPWWRDPADIPRREFLYDRRYVRRTIGATIAAGGRGKTTLGTYEAVSMAVGRDLRTGAALPSGPLRIAMWNGEEDQDELDRRVAATCQHYNVTEADLGGRLFVKSVRDHPLRIATLVKNIATLNANVLAEMLAFIEQNQIDVFMIDPFISFHSVGENDNVHMDLVIKEGLGAIANKTNSAGEILHHLGKPKPGQAEATADDARGASAIIAAVRAARVLNFMTPAEAEKLGMTEDERKRLVRIANGKANMGPLGAAKWMKFEVERLPNTDDVACASPWAPPDPFEGHPKADWQLARELAQTGEHRDDTRSPEWFGYALAARLGLRVTYKGQNDKKDLVKIKGMISMWLKNRVLDVETRKDEQRKNKNYVVPGTFEPEKPAQAYQPADDDVL